jgi:hypothetical protein
MMRLPSAPSDAPHRAHPLVLLAFAIITAVTLARSLAHVFLPDGGAQSIATIPLDAFPPAAAAAVVSTFALWGLSQGLLGLVYLAALLRYRGLIPLMLVLIVVEYAGRIAIGRVKPIETLATAPGEGLNYVMIPVALVLLALSRAGADRARRPSRARG